jgi:DNA-binding transcriptional ArsR family regulator
VTVEDEANSTYVDAGLAHVARANLIGDATAVRLAETFKALSDPTRVRIISILAHAELCVHDIAATLEMSHSAISHQLRTLRDLRLVKFRRQGRNIYYSLDDQHIQDLFRQGLDHILHE